jgi:hypothetical protein
VEIAGRISASLAVEEQRTDDGRAVTPVQGEN